MDLSIYHDPVKYRRSQINKASAMSGYLRQIIWANEYMRRDSRIYKTCIRPIMTYGIETREETNKMIRMLRVAEMNTLRTIMGKTRIDRIRNTEIREQCGVQDIVRWGRQIKKILVRSHEKNGRGKTATHLTHRTWRETNRKKSTRKTT